MIRIIFTVSFLVFSIFSSYSQSESVTVWLRVTENNVITPCNVKIADLNGNYFIPDSVYFWKTFYGSPLPDYPSNGKFQIKLVPGNYTYEIDRGPEYFLTKGTFTVDKKELHVNAELKRIIDLKKENWWSGELHIHRKINHIKRLMQARDLHIAPVITSWNNHYQNNADSIYNGTHQKFDNNRYYTTSGSEDERSGGAILVLNTPATMNFSQNHTPEYPPLAKSVERTAKKYGSQYWVDIDKPFWWDLPILLATGKVRSVGIAHNHMTINSVFDSEAWGKQRDTLIYPSPMGNGFWTQDIFYKILNTGVRIVPSAGSASGVLLNPVGYNRMYVYVKNNFNYENWFDQAGQGRMFVTNGPLLLCKANGKYPGEVFRHNQPVSITLKAKIYSRDSIESIEIIKNGKVYKTILGGKLIDNNLSQTISFNKSGWFLLRVISKVPGNFRFAATAPYYVEIGSNKNYISKSDARFFLEWTNERAASIKVDNEKEKAEISKYINAAKTFWQNKLHNANAE